MRSVSPASLIVPGKMLLLASAAFIPLLPAFAQSQPSDEPPGEQAEIVDDGIIVTATRKSTTLSRTPASIVAKGREELDVQGVRSIADIASITPGITFGQSPTLQGTGQSSISIRGVDSQSGIPTTGVYIDDTPIQTRVGVSPSLSNPYPQVFDLERIEVLRGPQGTLFGSGSVGGAIRFITPKPNFAGLDVYARSEIATTKHGDLSYEGGVAVGAPIVEDKIAFRASAWYRRDGGYIDRLDPFTLELVDDDIDRTDSVAARVAVGFKPTESLTITPSFFFQELRIDDGSRFELAVSNTSTANLRLGLNQIPEPRQDRFKLPALKAELDLGSVTLISDTSYFDRTTRTINDDFSLSFVFSGGLLDRPFPGGFEDYIPFTLNETEQSAFTQELRLQDNNQDDRFNWIVGLFYQNSLVIDQFAATDERLLDVINIGQEQIGEPPFANLTESFFGTELFQGTFSLFQRNESRDRQYAGYAQADYEIFDRLTLTAGLRYTIAEFRFVGFGAGPVLSTDGQTDVANTTSKDFTPKFGVSFQADRDNLFYANASKGVRGPGVSPPVGANCIDDAAAIGFDPFATLNVDPDSIWSYEIGSKNRLFGGKLGIDASAYRIDWQNVQTLFALPQCTIQTTLNLGSARIEGFDLALSTEPLEGLTLGGSVSYIDARFTTPIPGPNDTIVRQAGEPFPQVAPWTVQLNGEYVHKVADTELYGRADFSYSSMIQDPIDFSSPLVDPTLPRPPATSQLDLRLGGRFETGGGQQLDLSLFVNNLTNTQPLLSLFHETPDSTFFRAGSFRPRTVGLTLTVRN